MRFIRQPDGVLRLGDVLRAHLSGGAWTEFRGAVAFAKRAGVNYIAEELAEFTAHHSVTLSVGVDLQGTSKEGLQILLGVVTANGGDVWIHHNSHPTRPTFHPKLFLLKNPDRALVVIGSGNLTLGGLFTNYEANVAVDLDLHAPTEAAFLADIEAALDAWCDPSQGLARLLSDNLLADLERHGLIVPETEAGGDEVPRPRVGTPVDRRKEPPLFGKVAVPRPPGLHRAVPMRRTAGRRAIGAGHRGFLMTLQRTDVGVGQTTAGTSRRSPEVFVPLGARDDDPEFWGWRRQFREDQQRPGKWDRTGVRMRIGGHVVDINMMTWPVKHDFRLRSEALRRAGRIGDILRIERAPAHAGFDYYVEIVPQGTSEYRRRLAQCTHHARGRSRKRYGYY